MKKAVELKLALVGIEKLVDNIDEIVKLIRASRDVEQARRGLMERFTLSELQANAILDMRLQTLTNLQRSKIDEEYLQKIKEIEGYKLILDNVSFTVAPHEVVCLIGASGTGKSTLLKCINDLVPFDSGMIKLDGVSIHDPKFGKRELHKRIGIVFQAYRLSALTR